MTLTMLDVALGLITVYLMLGLACTAANEAIAQLFNMRAKVLDGALKNLLDAGQPHSVYEQFIKHPLIRNLRKTENSSPSYIAPSTFATVFLSVALKDSSAGTGAVVNSIEKMQLSPDLKETLVALVSRAGGRMDQVQQEIEQWYDHTMDRVSGWYKKRVQVITWIIAVTLTVAVNADSIAITQYLLKEQVVRASVAAYAEQLSKTQMAPSEVLQRSAEAIDVMGLPLGWTHAPVAKLDWMTKCIGLLITALATSLGAPFWFDMLQKVVNLRAAGSSPREKSAAASQQSVARSRGATSAHGDDAPELQHSKAS